MVRRVLDKKLKNAGWTIRNGAKHDQATNSDFPGIKISLPRHNGDIPIGTLNSILEDAGLKQSRNNCNEEDFI